MKTVQIMERKFYDGVVRQNHKTGWLCATDLIRIGNKYRTSIDMPALLISGYFKQKQTKEFIQSILEEEQVSSVKSSKRGKGGETWVHPLIFIDIAMWMNPKFKYTALSWLQDRLIQNRDTSGNSYKAMCGTLDKSYGLGAKIGIIIPQIARKIKETCGVSDWNVASEEQLLRRDRIHENIIMLCKAKVDLKKVVEFAIEQ